MIDSLIHLGNVLYLVAYAVKDILWLRVLTVVAAVALTAAYLHERLATAAAWEVIFGAVNVVWIVLIIRERRPVKLSEEEARLRDMTFTSLTAREIRELVAFGYWQEAAAGEVLIEEGVTPDRLIVIYSGRVSISVRDELIGECAEGTVLGEVSFLTQSVTTARVTVLEPTRFIWWRNHELRSFMERQPELRTLLLALLGAETANKLARR